MLNIHEKKINKYNKDPIYREKMKKYALSMYYLRKAERETEEELEKYILDYINS
tara:strand:- start:5340 stop:5501 length:162 start_codon:yes stop_codon:yes gene_type:complete